MAQKKIITLIDDLDPTGETEADETVTFGLDGKNYEIDLSGENAHRLRARLKEFIQAAREVKASPRRTARPMTEPAGPGATSSRHPHGDDPAEIRAWAIQEGVQLPKRGRLPSKVCAAYRAAKGHNRTLLEELLREQRGETASAEPAKPRRPLRVPEPAAVEDTDTLLLDLTPDAPATLRPATDPALHAANTVATRETQQPTPDSVADLDEATAREHYKPLTVFSPDAQKKKWKNRTAHGCTRTDKVEEMTLVERIQAIGSGASDRNVTILGQLAGIIPIRGGKVSYLSGSCIRLENLEMIQYDPESEHGWTITPFGEYAHKFHTVGG